VSLFFGPQVKTTAPKRYVVRPPQGCIEPGKSAVIKMSMVSKDSEQLWRDASEEKAKGIVELKVFFL
jgi:hypothetical protein